ncbi:MAG: hypothetical protein COA91_09370 [Robiginitomaculum sp.]|nr:MAG: hypothetical protein COA91_09370 [Robiginitomaculum sp.]
MNLLHSQTKKPTNGLAAEEKLSANSNITNKDTSHAADTQPTSGEEFSTFLTLLTAQIKNQDPLSPMDSTQFVEQLATFTNLELQAKGNQSLERITALLARQIELLTPSENTSDGQAAKMNRY